MVKKDFNLLSGPTRLEMEASGDALPFVYEVPEINSSQQLKGFHKDIRTEFRGQCLVGIYCTGEIVIRTKYHETGHKIGQLIGASMLCENVNCLYRDHGDTGGDREPAKPYPPTPVLNAEATISV